MAVDAGVLLREAGWHPARRIEVSGIVASLRDQGYEIDPRLGDLISNIANILLSFERGGRPDSIDVRPERALQLSEPEWVADYSRRARAALVPIGLSNHEHLLLLVSSAGRWYGGFEEEFGLLGHDIRESVDRVVNNRGFIVERSG